MRRDIAPGRHPLLEVFGGVDQLGVFRKYPLAAGPRRKLIRNTEVEVLARKGEWMYVAPHEVPEDADPRWKPVVSAGDCVVVSHEHLKKSPAMVLYLDILHEFFHVIQRKMGRELWDEDYSYVERPTELEAYAFAVREARRLDADDAFLREYLKVEWTTPKEHRLLLKNLGVSAGKRVRS